MVIIYKTTNQEEVEDARNDDYYDDPYLNEIDAVDYWWKPPQYGWL